MKVLVVYDSQFGNTEKIAQAIGGAFVAPHTVKVVKAGAATQADLAGVELLIVGSPTQGGRGTQDTQKFLNGIPAEGLKGVRVAAFDTRIVPKGGFVKLITRTFGYAAGRLATVLTSKGGTEAAPAEGFVVEGREGPLRVGELERAGAWAKTIAGS